jgi:hypothetical protein
MAILPLNKFCEIGKITLDFSAPEMGIVGVAFKVVDATTYYIFELGLDDMGEFKQVRKVINGKASILVRDDENGSYKPDTWTTIIIKLTREDEIKIQIQEDGSEEGILDAFPMPITDKELKGGTIGLATSKIANVIFDNIRMHPPDWDEGPEDLDEIGGSKPKMETGTLMPAVPDGEYKLPTSTLEGSW